MSATSNIVDTEQQLAPPAPLPRDDTDERTDGDGKSKKQDDKFLLSEESYRLAAYWREQVDAVNEEQKRWLKRGSTIVKRYRDERNRTDEDGARRFAALWSNVQTLLPTLYARVPLPVAERRFKDRDPVGRGAAQMLERGMRNEIEINGYDEAVSQAVLDYLLPGRGVAWVRYEPEEGMGASIPVDAEMEMVDDQGEIEPEDESEEGIHMHDTGDRIVRESVPIDYVPWNDFYMFPAKARIWKEVVAIGKRIYVTRDQLEERFGKRVSRNVPLQVNDRERRQQDEVRHTWDTKNEKAQVIEIWSKNDRKVYWIAEGYDFLCDRQDDPLRLSTFFPVPRPLVANNTNNSFIPVPDYIQYQDQAIQLDELTQRISQLSKACKVAGTYDAANLALRRLLDESVENELIPVDDWAVHAENGGLAGSVSFMPLKEVVECLVNLYTVKDKVMAEMDRLTGITDIMRGTGDARETMGGQRLKTNNTATRTQRRRDEVARFCRDIVRLMAEVMCMHFSSRSLVEVSGALFEAGLGEISLPPNLDAKDITPQNQQPGAPRPPQMPGPGTSPQQGPPGNVVPFQRPGAPPMGGAPGGPAQPPQGAAPGPGGPVSDPQSPSPQEAGPFPSASAGHMHFPGMPPQQLQQLQATMSPELAAQVEGLVRIVKSIALLRNDRLRGFRVDIEVDSTVYGDQQQEKEERVEFVKAMTDYLAMALQLSAQVPEIAPLLGKLLSFAARAFPISRELESAIEEFSDDAEKIAKQRASMAQQQPNPDLIKAQAQQTVAQAQAESLKGKAQGDQMRLVGDKAKIAGQQAMQQLQLQGEQMKQQQETQRNAQQLESDRVQAQAEVQRQQFENQGEQRNAEIDLEGKRMDMQMRQLEVAQKQREMEHERAKWDHEIRLREMDAQTKEKESDAKLEIADANVDRAQAQARKAKQPPKKPASGAKK